MRTPDTVGNKTVFPQQSEQSTEEKRRQHQKELAVSTNEAAKERLALLKGKKENQKVRKSTISYKSTNLLPREPEIADLKIYVGELKEYKRSVRKDLAH